MSRTSANDATTETCFCDLHDNILFAVIEKGAPDYDDSNEEMKFIYAYKAFMFEYYKQSKALDIYKECLKKNPVAFKSTTMVGMYRMLQLKMREFEPIKSHFDKEIMSNTHNGIATYCVKIPEQIKFADYAYIAPDYDLNVKNQAYSERYNVPPNYYCISRINSVLYSLKLFRIRKTHLSKII